jgi:acyl-coenzyme A thioesterase 13
MANYSQNRLKTIHGGTLASLVDLGGSLAVASTGRFATGVSTDLNGMYDTCCSLPGVF